MSSLTDGFKNTTNREAAKRLANCALQDHIPVGSHSRRLFSALYYLHITARASALWTARFLWFEPLFRSQCQVVGSRFRMEQLPYLLGRGQIVIGERQEDGVSLGFKRAREPRAGGRDRDDAAEPHGRF